MNTVMGIDASEWMGARIYGNPLLDLRTGFNEVFE